MKDKVSGNAKIKLLSDECCELLSVIPRHLTICIDGH